MPCMKDLLAKLLSPCHLIGDPFSRSLTVTKAYLLLTGPFRFVK